MTDLLLCAWVSVSGLAGTCDGVNVICYTTGEGYRVLHGTEQARLDTDTRYTYQRYGIHFARNAVALIQCEGGTKRAMIISWFILDNRRVA